ADLAAGTLGLVVVEAEVHRPANPVGPVGERRRGAGGEQQAGGQPGVVDAGEERVDGAAVHAPDAPLPEPGPAGGGAARGGSGGPVASRALSTLERNGWRVLPPTGQTRSFSSVAGSYQ